MDYSYPFSIEWSTEEIIDVVSFFEGIEMAYEKGINRQELLTRYRKFKQVVPAISEEKTYFREFEEESGYASFPVIKEMKAGSGDGVIKIKTK
ncbi:UPF0223 family protein [Microbacterium sp. APC 3898]|uniref:UPF0223 family protein n=2 Tax=Planococcus TaxID=1372 RepID=A0ABT7ZG06_9BACL|nr:MULTISPECIES: UPF0223 family protein [Terrabacteria group]MBF6634566.1 UPF0223 family protein [Planococcus sp. (in: firmicutes)]MBD8013723.1 UPF0223 family protein [Planococcus wigleyi]MDN3426026.1 UPF0223 family protein [Planococcus sp. APC 4016]MDN3437620.1 UPF0223 family protein [Planococcus sp. APC 3900]MDN3497723.1 UPF0223 family protein [Microbacterium sp. APC 3898]